MQTQTQQYAYTTPYTEGQTIAEDHCKTLAGWERQPIPATDKRFQTPTVEALAKYGIVPVTMKEYPDDGQLRETSVVMGPDGPVQQGTVITSETPCTDAEKAAKIEELRAARWDAEVGGITLPNGMFIRTDKQSQAEMDKALGFMKDNPDFEIDWEFADGTILSVKYADVLPIATAAYMHIQGTRTKFKQKKALVDAAVTRGDLDAITWE